MASQERSPKTYAALNALLREVTLPGASKDFGVQRTMLGLVPKIRAAHEDRLELANAVGFGVGSAILRSRLRSVW